MQRRDLLILSFSTLILAACNENKGETEVSLSFLGLSEDEATALARENNIPFRVVERDGQPLPATRDYRPGRINATVENGVIVQYNIEGTDEVVS